MNLKCFCRVAVSSVVSVGILFWCASSVVAMWQEPSSSNLAYQFVDKGGISLSTAGSVAENTAITYTRIQPGAGGTTPSGFGIFGFRNSQGVLLTETSVPAESLLQEGRTFATYGKGVANTGIAFVNPNDQQATINFFFTDPLKPEGERDFGGDVLTLGPNQHIARFISEEPFNVESGTNATLTFTSSLPVATIALIEETNVRGDAIYSTLPVADLSAPLSKDTVYIPHFAESGGWQTEFILINPTNEPITGRLGFVSSGVVNPNNSIWDDPGLSTPVALNGPIGQSVYSYRIEPKAHFIYRTWGGLFLQTGSARVIPNPDDGSSAPIVQVVFASLDKENFATPVSYGAYSATSTGTAFRMYVERSGTLGAVGAIRSGLAINNIEFERADVALSLTNLEGKLILSGVLPVPPSGQRALFLDEVFDEATFPNPFKGVLRVATTGNQQIAVVALRSRVNEREEFLISTTPPANESSTATTFEVVFPHLVDGGGWSTQTVLFSGAAGQSSNGLMRFFGVNGQPFDIPLQ